MIYDITSYGAVGDGSMDCTAKIQQAINECSAAGGGTVAAPPGTYLFYTLYLKSGVELRIEAGATLLAGPDPLKYPEIRENRIWRVPFVSRRNRRTIFYAEKADHIAVTGRGTIQCRGELFMQRDTLIYPGDPARMTALHNHWLRRHDTEIPGRCFFFVGCSDVLMEDITIWNSPSWNIWILDCDRVQITRIKTDADFRIPNNDGIHISASRDVTVSDCVLRCSDDTLIVRAHQEQLWTPKPAERISVSNCVLTSGSAAVRLGWTHDYTIRDCIFSNLTIHHSLCGFALYVPPLGRLNTCPPRYPGMPTPPEVKPFSVENIRFDNISMEVETGMFFLWLAEDAEIDHIRGIHFSNINAVCGSPIYLEIPKAFQVSDLSFDNIRIHLKDMRSINENLEQFAEYREQMNFSCAKELSFNNFSIQEE